MRVLAFRRPNGCQSDTCANTARQMEPSTVSAGAPPGCGSSALLAQGSLAGRRGKRLDGESLAAVARLIRFQIHAGIGARIQLHGTRLGCDPEYPLLCGRFGRLADLKLGDGAQDGPLQLGQSWIVRGEILILLELLESRTEDLNKTGRARKHHVTWMHGKPLGVDRERPQNDPSVAWRQKEFSRCRGFNRRDGRVNPGCVPRGERLPAERASPGWGERDAAAPFRCAAARTHRHANREGWKHRRMRI